MHHLEIKNERFFVILNEESLRYLTYSLMIKFFGFARFEQPIHHTLLFLLLKQTSVASGEPCNILLIVRLSQCYYVVNNS